MRISALQVDFCMRPCYYFNDESGKLYRFGMEEKR